MDSRAELDLILVTRYLAGDEDAFTILYEYYAPLLQRWATVKLSGYHRGDVEDIVQKVFIKFHADCHKVSISHVCGYLRILLTRQVVDFQRYILRQKRNLEFNDHYRLVIPDDPAITGEHNEIIKLLRSLIDQLSVRERHCVEAYMEGFSCREYALEIGTHINNVKRWTAKGLKRLRYAYRRQYPD